jgi:dihydrofolate synthase/folylpolyglutamate synthase
MITSVFERLEALERFGIKLGLQNIRTLLQALGNPQNHYPSILIAGTNGKGSVGAMLHAILQRNGFYTAHYASPHLIDIRERLKAGNELISFAEFASELDFVFQTVDRLSASGDPKILPTYFEVVTATAFQYFSRLKVNYAVVEVGLGGRLDATNIVRQQLSIITSIDFDHEQHLGKSLAEIASEKAGILKPNAPLVTGPLPPEAASIISQAVAETNCFWERVDPAAVRNLHLQEGFPVFDYHPWGQQVRINLRGKHQARNAAIALQASDRLKDLGVKIDRTQAIEALNEVSWPGRLEILPFDPPVLLDCAHNPMGVRVLSEFLQDLRWEKIIVLYTAMRDKNIASMLSYVSQKTETIFLTRVEPLPRCASLEQLAALATGFRNVRQERDPETAWKHAMDHAASTHCPLVVFGSIYLIGKILSLLPPSSSSSSSYSLSR